MLLSGWAARVLAGPDPSLDSVVVDLARDHEDLLPKSLAVVRRSCIPVGVGVGAVALLPAGGVDLELGHVLSVGAERQFGGDNAFLRAYS